MSQKMGVRPTKAVVIKALCDILRPVVNDLTLLELYAGTGRVSEKLLAEGAEVAYAVDRSRPRRETDGIIWFQQEVEEFIQKSGPPEPVDFVYMDPPYGSVDLHEILAEILESGWLTSRALVAVETSVSHPGFPREIGAESQRSLAMMREREYGGTRLTIFQLDRESPGV